MLCKMMEFRFECGIITSGVLNKIIDARQAGKNSIQRQLWRPSGLRLYDPPPLRNRLIVLLSVKAGLRAGEIANPTWEMVLTPPATSDPQSNCTTGRPRNRAGG